MKNIFMGLLLFMSAPALLAEIWKSPTEVKYEERSVSLYKDLSEARTLIDSYRGDSQALVTAKKLLDRILEKDSKFVLAYVEYARLIMKSGHISFDNFLDGTLTSTEEILRKSIALEPDYADAYVLLGHLYTQQRKLKEAEEALLTADKIGTLNPWLQNNWGDLLKRQNKKDEAIERYRRVYEDSAVNKTAKSYALLQLAIQHTFINTIQAKAWYEKLVGFEPESAWNWMEYSKFQLFWDGDINGAIESAEKAISIMDFEAGRFTLGCALYAKWAALAKSGNVEEAKKYFIKANKVYSDRADVLNAFNRFPGTVKAKGILSEFITREYEG